MKNAFQRMHHTALIAFPLITILMVAYSFFFGAWPTVLILLWMASLGLLIVVLLACITKNVVRCHQEKTLGRLALRYLLCAAGAIVLLILLDLVAGKILWGLDLAVGAALGLLGLYRKP